MTQSQRKVSAHSGQVWLSGALAGCIATIPMTLFMLTTQRFLPKGQRYALPPEIITTELAHRVHIKRHMSKKQIVGATLVSHFGYGAAMGMLYSPIARRIPLPMPVQGILFGCIVWAGSYLGLLPLLGMIESGQREPMRRNLMMIATHIVWGAALGTIGDALSHRNNSD